MALFDTFYLFSEVNGLVLHNGQPVVGAEIEQTCHWTFEKKDFAYRTKTDATGRFYLPAITAKQTLLSFFPHEPVIKQKILIHHQGQRYLAWNNAKRNYDNNGEINEFTGNNSEPLKHAPNIMCDLSNSEELLETRIGKDILNSPFGICTLTE